MPKRVKVRKTTNKQTPVELTKMNIRFPEIERHCPDCRGTGIKGFFCYKCNGEGLVPTEMALALLRFIPHYIDIRGECSDQYLWLNRS